jgi:hypothetical protein
MKRTTITLPDELAEKVDLEAKRQQTSVSDVVRQLIAQGLPAPRVKPRKIPWAGLFHDPDMVQGSKIEEALGGWTDDIDRDRG